MDINLDMNMSMDIYLNKDLNPDSNITLKRSDRMFSIISNILKGLERHCRTYYAFN